MHNIDNGYINGLPMSINKLYKIKKILILILIFSIPQTLFAQLSKQQLEDNIYQIDAQFKKDRYEKDRTKMLLNRISKFSGIAQSWFVKLEQNEANIKATKEALKTTFVNRYGDTEEFDWSDDHNTKYKAKLQQYIRKRDSIIHLEGTTVVSYFGRSCTTINKLRNEFSKAAREAIKLNKKYYDLMSKIKSYYTKRSKLTAQLKSTGWETELSEESAQDYLRDFKEEYQHYQKLANDPNIWYVSQYHSRTSLPIYMHRRFAIELITKRYLKQIKNSGRKFNPNELSKRIKQEQTHSNTVKDRFRHDFLTNLAQKIEKLEKKLNIKSVRKELSGCWIIKVGKGKSIIQVQKDQNNVYHGILIKNNLKYYKKGDEVFTVKRISYNSFKGIDNTFTLKGMFVKMPLIITIHRNNTLTYKSDSISLMRRCK